MTEPPLLSIAIATHDGRRAALAELLDSIGHSLARCPGERIQVSVSDNASADGTEAMVAEKARVLPCELAYNRFERNEGLAANLAAAVAAARGRYCWTVGSDDLVAPDGIATVLGALRRDEGLTGLVVGSVDVNPQATTLRTRQPPPAFFPEPRAPAVFEDADEILRQCGNAWGALSWSVLDRELWLASAAKRSDLIAAHPVFPQVIVKAGMALDRPRWGWEPAVALHRRGADPFIFEGGGVSMARKWADLLGGCCDAWAGVLGGRNARWRRQVRRVQRVWGKLDDVRGSKLYEDPSRADQLALLASWSRSLWPTAPFWRDLLPALLAPPALVRRLHDPVRSAHPESHGGDGAGPEATVSAELPPRVVAGTTPPVAVSVTNRTARPLTGSGPGALGVWQRWRDAEGRLVDWDELGVDEIGRAPIDLQRRLWPRQRTELGISLFAPREPGTYELTLAGHRHGIGWLDGSGRGGVSGRVEVEATAGHAPEGERR